MKTLTNESIKAFVRDVLGCTCPEEVFKKIECDENITLDNGIKLSYKINIGDRLLIYIYCASESQSNDIPLRLLVDCGEQERNDNGFNRFRLALLCDKPEDIKDDLSTSFSLLKKDEKIHLHVIGSDVFL